MMARVKAHAEEVRVHTQTARARVGIFAAGTAAARRRSSLGSGGATVVGNRWESAGWLRAGGSSARVAAASVASAPLPAGC
jgi:hypothetical protein